MNTKKNIIEKLTLSRFSQTHLSSLSSEANYREFLKNKKIALVGPADYLENSNLGNEIDSFDLVVRINRGIELIGKYHKDIGQRTDILYSCLIEQPTNAGIIDPVVYSNEYKLKYICTTPFPKRRFLSKSIDIHPMADKEKFRNLSTLIPTRIIPLKFWRNFSKELETRPTTGYISIFDILEFKPKELKIFGFSFYMTNILKGYKKGMKQKEENFNELALKSTRHEHHKMLTFAKKTLLKKENVNFDPFLQKLLKKSY